MIYKVDDVEMDKTCCTHDKLDDIRNFWAEQLQELEEL